MAEVTRHRIGELLRGVFKILMESPNGLAAKEVLTRLPLVVPPSPFEDSEYPERPSVRRYEKIVRFATIAPVKAGWMVKDRGEWSLTPTGVAAFQRHTEPEQFAREASKRYRQWEQEQPISEEPEIEESPEPSAILEEAEEAAWLEIVQFLTEMNPYDLQNLVAGLLRGMGYHVMWVAPPGPDRGIDIIAYEDPLGVKGPTIKVQVKRRQDRTSVEGLRAFMAQLGGADIGLFVCTGGFTKDAEDEARSQQLRRVTLVDARRLVELLVEFNERIPDTSRRLLPLRNLCISPGSARIEMMASENRDV